MIKDFGSSIDEYRRLRQQVRSTRKRAPGRGQLKRQTQSIRKQNQRQMNKHGLGQLGKSNARWKPFSTHLTINGDSTANRPVWISAAKEYQNRTYVGPSDTTEVITARFNKWRSQAICDKMDGVRVIAPDVFDILQCLAGMAPGKAVAYGTPPIEYFQYLSFPVKVTMARWKINFVWAYRYQKPTGWNSVQLVGVQGSAKTGGIEKLRWVGKTAAAQKWYLESVVGVIEKELRPTPVISVGFEKGGMIEDITGIILDLLAGTRNWDWNRHILDLVTSTRPLTL